MFLKESTEGIMLDPDVPEECQRGNRK